VLLLTRFRKLTTKAQGHENRNLQKERGFDVGGFVSWWFSFSQLLLRSLVRWWYLIFCAKAIRYTVTTLWIRLNPHAPVDPIQVSLNIE
jgi:hypothetical protein